MPPPVLPGNRTCGTSAAFQPAIRIDWCGTPSHYDGTALLAFLSSASSCLLLCQSRDIAAIGCSVYYNGAMHPNVLTSTKQSLCLTNMVQCTYCCASNVQNTPRPPLPGLQCQGAALRICSALLTRGSQSRQLLQGWESAQFMHSWLLTNL